MEGIFALFGPLRDLSKLTVARTLSHRFRTGLPTFSARRTTTTEEMLACECATFSTSAIRHVVAAHLAAPRALSPEAVPAAVKAAARTDTLKVVLSTVLVSKT